MIPTARNRTPYDIAGKGKADASSMVAAMRLAVRLAAQQRTP